MVGQAVCLPRVHCVMGSLVANGLHGGDGRRVQAWKHQAVLKKDAVVKSNEHE